MRHNLLILGGTTEARELAGRLAGRNQFDVTLSLAGRTRAPAEQGVATRSGGFGGADGLAAYLTEHRVTLLVVATHPFAARMPFNAARAAQVAGVPVLSLLRPAWRRQAGDDWVEVDTIAEAVTAIGPVARRVFVTFGRQDLGPLETAPQHHYLIRSIDPVEPPLALLHADYLLSRGPFDAEAEHRLLAERGIEIVLAKNAGGTATEGKIIAARSLGLPVIMVRRPQRPAMREVSSVEAMMTLIEAHPASPAKRGE